MTICEKETAEKIISPRVKKPYKENWFRWSVSRGDNPSCPFKRDLEGAFVETVRMNDRWVWYSVQVAIPENKHQHPTRLSSDYIESSFDCCTRLNRRTLAERVSHGSKTAIKHIREGKKKGEAYVLGRNFRFRAGVYVTSKQRKISTRVIWVDLHFSSPLIFSQGNMHHFGELYEWSIYARGLALKVKILNDIWTTAALRKSCGFSHNIHLIVPTRC